MAVLLPTGDTSCGRQPRPGRRRRVRRHLDKALAAMLGDPNEPNLLAIFFKCDEAAWRASLFNAAHRTVHDSGRATPPPAGGAAPPAGGLAATPTVVLTQDEIRAQVPKLAAALTRDERIWPN
jgi:hypothetical protein